MDGRPDPQEPKLKTRRRIEGQRHARALNWACFGNQPFLSSERMCRWLIECIDTAREKHGFHLWAWCFMPTHVHMLIDPGHPDAASPVSDILRSIKLPLTQRVIAWAREHDAGTLELMKDLQPNGTCSLRHWQRGGGYDRNLFERRTIMEMIDYIHMNPVEARLCARAEDWPWSSAMSYLDRTKGPLRIDWESMAAI